VTQTISLPVESRRSNLRRLGLAACAFLCVFVTAWLGTELSVYTQGVAAIWIAEVVALPFLLRSPGRDWPLLVAASIAGDLVSNLMVGGRLSISTVLALCNLAEMLIVAIPLRMLKVDQAFERPRSLLIFYSLALGPAPLAAALIARIGLHVIVGAPILKGVPPWYASNALGLAILLPPLMTVRLAALKAMFAKDQRLVSVLLLGAVGAVAALDSWLSDFPLAYLFFPAVVLCTFHRGVAGGALALAIVSVYLLADLILAGAHGIFTGGSIPSQLLVAQLFIAVIGFTVLLMGAALQERERLEQGLAEAIVRAEKAREEALHANRTKSAFLANMSHELRTPLNAIIGFSEMILQQIFGPIGHVRYREYMSDIHGAGVHLLDLINDVLDMSRIEAGKHELQLEPVAIDKLIASCTRLVHELAAKGGVKLATEQPDCELRALADHRAMKQILLNLLSNAIKFTPRDGCVTVRAGQAGERLTLSVADSGMGIPADQIARLGDPFVQVRRDSAPTHKGTGLGLALVRSLAQLHGGSMRIESVEGQGTTVTVELPLSPPAIVAVAA
jgi:signal transduction histidine kinase